MNGLIVKAVGDLRSISLRVSDGFVSRTSATLTRLSATWSAQLDALHALLSSAWAAQLPALNARLTDTWAAKLVTLESRLSALWSAKLDTLHATLTSLWADKLTALVTRLSSAWAAQLDALATSITATTATQIGRADAALSTRLSGIKSIQRGVIQVTGANLTAVQALAPPVNPAKTIIRYLGHTANSVVSGHGYPCTLRLSADGTQIIATRTIIFYQTVNTQASWELTEYV